MTTDWDFDWGINDFFDDGRELEWKEGIHTDRNGNEYKIKDMTTEHIKNTINYFNELDTSPLKEELRKRL